MPDSVACSYKTSLISCQARFRLQGNGKILLNCPSQDRGSYKPFFHCRRDALYERNYCNDKIHTYLKPRNKLKLTLLQLFFHGPHPQYLSYLNRNDYALYILTAIGFLDVPT
jgi:hypothetical protein